jgi:hypothetical protein
MRLSVRRAFLFILIFLSGLGLSGIPLKVGASYWLNGYKCFLRKWLEILEIVRCSIEIPPKYFPMVQGIGGQAMNNDHYSIIDINKQSYLFVL